MDLALGYLFLGLLEFQNFLHNFLLFNQECPDDSVPKKKSYSKEYNYSTNTN
jgi:hypothetical protein